jgi:catechol 2,3-dioxygenase-like lactoylglutathione lyase family enzyme
MAIIEGDLATRLIGVNHVGMTVRDLDQSLAFYRNVFGLEPLVQGIGDSSEIAKSMGLDEMRIRYAFLQLGNTRLELLQFERPAGRSSYDMRSCDVGAFHVCFEVADLPAKYAQLKALGVDFVTSPIHLAGDSGSLAGLRFVYFRDPDGLMFQLYEVPTA